MVHRFALPLACLSSLLGCSLSTTPTLVTEADYLNREKCWNGRGNQIEGFLIVRRNTMGNYSSSFVSAHCYLEPDMSWNWRSFDVTGDDGELMHLGAIDRPLSDNIVTDQMPGSSVVRVLVFRGNLRPMARPEVSFPAYHLHSIEFAADSGLTVDQMFSMGPEARLRTFERISREAQ